MFTFDIENTGKYARGSGKPIWIVSCRETGHKLKGTDDMTCKLARKVLEDYPIIGAVAPLKTFVGGTPSMSYKSLAYAAGCECVEKSSESVRLRKRIRKEGLWYAEAKS